MKLNLFLLASIFAALHLCKAVPLRLHKRAAFYIANETACVVDNIVYSNGEPIPTDDPCEACKCRPPGFACVLKECKVKPGCRAVRHAGHCCPEYICDVPDSNSLNENNAAPSLNWIPILNDEFVVPENLPTSREPESSEILTESPTDPSRIADKVKSTFHTEEYTDEPNTSQTTVSEISVSQESEPYPVTEGESTHKGTLSTDNNNNEPTKEVTTDKNIEESEKKVLFNSEVKIQKDEKAEITTVKNEDLTEPSEVVKEDSYTTVTSREEQESETKVTEKPSETEYTSTEIPTTEKQIKNSAADNSKSLKISDYVNGTEEPSNKSEEKEIKIEEPEKLDSKLNETITQPPTELSSETNPVHTTEGKHEYGENIAEESQNNPQAAFYNNDGIIKSESAETVTIVVHVKEKEKLTTETDFVTERTTTDSKTPATQENLLKSNYELKSTEISTESVEVENVTPKQTNFEVFPSSTETSKGESSTNSPVTDEKLKEAEGRSDEIKLPTADAEENPTNNDKKSSEVTITQNEKDIADSTTAEAKAEEEKTKKDYSTDSEAEISKTEEPAKIESEKSITEETKYEESAEINPEVREDDSKSEEKGTTPAENIKQTTETVKSTPFKKEETKPEERTAEEKSTEKTDIENVENTKPKETQENKSKVTTESIDQVITESTETETPKNDNE